MTTLPTKSNERYELFRRLHPDELLAAYPGWLRQHSAAFRAERGIRRDFIPPDMQDEFTTYLKAQYL
jgi:hypothetical protein